MKLDRNFVVIIGFIIGLCFLYIWIRPTDEELVRSHLESLSENLTFSSSDNRIKKLAKAKRGSEHFLEFDILVSIPIKYRESKKITSRKDLSEYAALIMATVDDLTFRFKDFEIQIGGQIATANATAHMFINGNTVPTLSHLKFKLIKDSGDWVIKEAVSTNTLEL